MSFFAKLNQAITQNQSVLIIGLDPNPEMMPRSRDEQDNPEQLIQGLYDWLAGIIQSTRSSVCAYKPTLGFYQALGSPGFELLTKIISLIPCEIPIILDAKHGDINTSSILARTIFEQWQVDAVTLSPYTGQDHAAPFLLYPDKGVFVLCHTSNPEAIAIQEYPSADAPLYLQVVKETKNWGTQEQLFLEVGTADPEIFKSIREIAPERLILARSLWSKNDNLEAILAAGLNEQGDGLLIPVPQDFFDQDDLTDSVESLRLKIEEFRQKTQRKKSSCELWVPDVCLLSNNPHQDLILQLYDIGCLLFGEYVQASGATFSYYIDLRRVISNPQIFHQVLQAYADILGKLSFDRLAGIPYGSLPTATGLSLMLHHPMIYPRKEVKAHGTRRLIEGNFHPGETVVIVDDILISGKSVMEGADKLESAGLTVRDIVVFIDHEEGVIDKLKNQGYSAYSVLKISEITDTLYAAGRISETQFQSLKKYSHFK